MDCNEAPNVVISHIHYDGEAYRTEKDEYIEISNTGGSDVDISGYKINADDRGQDFTFPEGTILKAGESFKVYTNEDHPESGGFKFGSGRAIWNNLGDVGHLYSPDETEVSTYNYGDKNEDPNVIISHIHYDGEVYRTEKDEYVEISNTGGSDADISGWRINADDKGQDFVFPAGTILKAGESFKVYTNEDHSESGGFKFGSGRAIWNNKGDAAHLFGADGTEVSTCRYGDAPPPSGPPLGGLSDGGPDPDAGGPEPSPGDAPPPSGPPLGGGDGPDPDAVGPEPSSGDAPLPSGSPWGGFPVGAGKSAKSSKAANDRGKAGKASKAANDWGKAGKASKAANAWGKAGKSVPMLGAAPVLKASVLGAPGVAAGRADLGAAPAALAVAALAVAALAAVFGFPRRGRAQYKDIGEAETKTLGDPEAKPLVDRQAYSTLD